MAQDRCHASTMTLRRHFRIAGTRTEATPCLVRPSRIRLQVNNHDQNSATTMRHALA